MPFIKLQNFKLGISPSERSAFNMQALTGTQKLRLVQARIFGNAIGGNLHNGNQVFKKLFVGQRRVDQYELPVHNPTQIFPFMRDYDDEDYKAGIIDGRKMRIMMRGIKIGRQKGGGKLSILDIYERKKEEAATPDDLKTDLQYKFKAVDCIEVPQKYIQQLHCTIKTLTKLLNIRIRTDLPNVPITHFQDTMTELLKVSKQMAAQILNRQNQSLQETVRQHDLETRLQQLEDNTSNQLKDLTLQNQELQSQVDDLLKYREMAEKSNEKYKEMELAYKKVKHSNEQLKSQNSNLQSLMRQVKEEKGSNIEQKLLNLKGEVQQVSGEYQRKLEQRDEYISKLEREMGLLRSELEMSEDYRQLTQSSKKQRSP